MSWRSRLPIAPLGIGLAALTVVIGVGGALLNIANHNAFDIGGIAVFTFLAFPAMGLVILRYRPGHVIGYLLLAISVSVYFDFAASDYARYAVVQHPGSLPFGEAIAWMSGWNWIAFLLLVAVFLPLVFPDGRLLSRRWWIVIAGGLTFAVIAFAGNAFVPGPANSAYPDVINPLGMKGHESLFTTLQNLALPVIVLTFVGSVSSVVIRYRRADPAQRHQLRWFLFALLLALIPFLAHGLVPNVVAELLVALAIPLVPAAIAIAVLRYRLYDLAVVINRALVYGALAAFITAVYVGIVVGVGALIDSGGRPNLALSILATVVVAVAFQPVRTRVQALANRLVYGYRATPYEALTAFSHRVAGAYANEDVLPRLAQVLAAGTGATVTSVWIRRAGEPVAAATWPPAESPVDIGVADRVAQVRHQGETLGELTVKKRAGEPLTPVEETLLNDLAAQAGQVLRNVRLTSELQARLDEISAQAVELRASRQRIVSVQDAERRRLERNIHDGAQQHLVALAVKLRLAATLMKRDVVKAQRLLKELDAQTGEARQTVHDLAQGIYPPALRERGLVEALHPHAQVTAEDIGRYDAELEAGVYFCCLEAIQNATKYARASHVTVRLRQKDGDLEFSVIDDGAGFDPRTVSTGTGVQNMKDRVASLGGRLSLQSKPGKGTTVSGLLPLSVPARAAS